MTRIDDRPAEHGVFLACDAGDVAIVIKTYMGECHEMWSELARALKALRRFDEQALGIFHGAVCFSEWGWEIDEAVVDELCRVWREWVWLNRERKDRPGGMRGGGRSTAGGRLML